jgi:hypothetical protein
VKTAALEEIGANAHKKDMGGCTKQLLLSYGGRSGLHR